MPAVTPWLRHLERVPGMGDLKKKLRGGEGKDFGAYHCVASLEIFSLILRPYSWSG